MKMVRLYMPDQTEILVPEDRAEYYLGLGYTETAITLEEAEAPEESE